MEDLRCLNSDGENRYFSSEVAEQVKGLSRRSLPGTLLFRPVRRTEHIHALSMEDVNGREEVVRMVIMSNSIAMW